MFCLRFYFSDRLPPGQSGGPVSFPAVLVRAISADNGSQRPDSAGRVLWRHRFRRLVGGSFQLRNRGKTGPDFLGGVDGHTVRPDAGVRHWVCRLAAAVRLAGGTQIRPPAVAGTEVVHPRYLG